MEPYETRPGLLAIVTQTLNKRTLKWEASGHPCVTRDVDQAVKLRDALTEFINRTQAAG